MGGGYFGEDPATPSVPTRILRVLLWAEAAITAAMAVAGLAAAVAGPAGLDGPVVGGLAAMAWPGVVACWVALRIGRPSRAMFAWLLAGSAWQLTLAVAELPGGDPRGATSLLLPLVVTILLCTRPVRTHLRASGTDLAGVEGSRLGGPGVDGPATSERGASAVEYAGLIVVAALLLGSLTALGMSSRVGGSVHRALCVVLTLDSCTPATRRTTATDPNARRPEGRSPAARNPNGTDTDGRERGGRGADATPPGDGRPGSGDPSGTRGVRDRCHGPFGCAWHALTTDPYDMASGSPCHGVLSCLGHGAAYVFSSQYNVDKAVVDDATALVGLARDPRSLGAGLSYSWHHPATAARQMIWDDQSAMLWHNGNHIGAAGRAIYNIGSWLLPGPDLLKGAGRLTELGKAPAKTAKLARLARAAHDAARAAGSARRLAARGDYKGAREAAADARRKADAAKDEARRRGCRRVSLGALPVHIAGRFAAPVSPEPPADDPCGAAAAADRDADNAAAAAHPPKGITGFTEHGAANRLNRDGHGVAEEAMRDAVQRPVKPPVFRPDKYGGTWRFEGGDAVVVLNKDGRVVTTWPRSRDGWRHH